MQERSRRHSSHPLDTYLEIAALRDQPLVDKRLRRAGEAEQEVAVDLVLVDQLHGLMHLVVQALDLQLTRRRQQERVHLRLQRVVDLKGRAAEFERGK